ncbi:MAG: hypothetical protein OEZ20_04610 [candidate division WOR-3 bacterium]|nr:hypothetical protein [candidate division WOR-3 bacterium]
MSWLRLIFALLTIFILIIGALLLPPGKEIPLRKFANSNLIGYAKIEIDPKNEIVQSWIQKKVENSWTRRQKNFTAADNRFLKIARKIQNFLLNTIVSKLRPYYVGALFYAPKDRARPVTLYLINARSNPFISWLIDKSILILSPNRYRTIIDSTDRLETEPKKYKILQFDRCSLMFFKNLCLITDTIINYQYAFSNSDSIPLPNLSMMSSLLSAKSDFRLILDNRFKTLRLAYKYLEPRKFTLATKFEKEFYQNLIERLKNYSDSIVMMGIEANIIDEDKISGKWLIVVNNKNSARRLTIVVDGIHQLASQELEKRNLIYRVSRTLKNHTIESEFIISGVKNLIGFN